MRYRTRARRSISARFLAWGAALVVAAVVSGGSPRTASASQGEVTTWFDTSVVSARGVSDQGTQLGIAGQVGALVGISTFWSVTAGVDGAYLFSRTLDDQDLPGVSVQSVFAGFRYNLDIFAYVPYLGVAIGEYLRAPPDEPGQPQRPAVGPRLTIGVDWRFSRYWSVGVKGDLHAIDFTFTPFPNYATVGATVGYHFRL